MMNRKRFAAGAFVALGLSAGFGINTLRAGGVPQTHPLFYSGTLTESGQAINGTRDLEVSLWKRETSTDASDRTCSMSDGGAHIENGRFRVALDDCVTAVHAEPEQWVEVKVGGIAIGERAKLGAVPYAVEADRATSAAGALEARIAALEADRTSAATAAAALEARIAALEAASPSKSAFRAHASVAQIIKDVSLGHTRVVFDVVDFDLGTEFVPGTAADDTSSTFTTKTGGYYEIGCTVLWNISAKDVFGYWEVHVWVNDVARISHGGYSDGYFALRAARSLLRLNAGDKVQCKASQSSNADRSLDARADSLESFEAIRISL
jgi:hypothetical protein